MTVLASTDDRISCIDRSNKIPVGPSEKVYQSLKTDGFFPCTPHTKI